MKAENKRTSIMGINHGKNNFFENNAVLAHTLEDNGHINGFIECYYLYAGLSTTFSDVARSIMK
jgi:hypothetical protein